jgi:hypothetical protein
MIDLVKTNVAGFSKNKKSNVLINTDLSRMTSIREERQKAKVLKMMQDRINMLEYRLALLESKVT